MSDQQGFVPLSAQLGIPGSSYMIQLGKVNNIWSVRLAKGPNVLDSKVFHNYKDPEGNNPPNANTIVGWILQVLPIPNLNPYQIVKSVGFIRQESIRRSEEAKRKPQISLKEAKTVKLEAIPEGVKKTRPKSVGWVKEEPVKPKEEPVKPKEEPTEKKRALPQIPMGGGEKAAVSTSTPTKGIKCGSCGTEIKFCPYCGKPLDKH